MDPDLSVEDLAATVGYSTGEVQRRFKAAFGATPKNWLHHYRIVIAARILANKPAHTVESVMQSCGYRSRSLFYRMFQRHMGCSPGDLRKRSADER